MENKSDYDNSHYDGGVLRVDCMDFARFMSFAGGNVFKYIWRAGLKGDELEDLYKAMAYLEDCVAYGTAIFIQPGINKTMIAYLDRMMGHLEHWKYKLLKEFLNGNLEQTQIMLWDRISICKIDNNSTDDETEVD